MFLPSDLYRGAQDGGMRGGRDANQWKIKRKEEREVEIARKSLCPQEFSVVLHG